MMNKRMKFFATPLIAGLFFLFVLPVYAQTFAGTLLFDPTSRTINVGDTIDVRVNINTGTDEVDGADAYITFDPNVLEYQSISNGSFFPQVFKAVKSSTLLYVGGLRESGAVVRGSGTIATITFRGRANGSTTLSYSCGSGTNESTIVKTGGTNVIQCGSNGTSAITVGSGGSSPTNTPTPTTASSGSNTPTPTTATSGGNTNPTATRTPTPATKGGLTATAKPTAVSKLPESGVVENITGYAGLGVLLFLLGIGARYLL